jgi:regulator of protease activity HflC (stomatin/prohibitin superfamily)
MDSKKLVPGGIGAAILAFVLLNAVHIVPAGHVGVVKLFGDVRPEPLKPGFHVLNPLTSVYDFNVRFQSAAAAKAEGGTSDLQEVFEDLTLNYEYDAAYAPYLYSNFGGDGDIEAKFIIPALYESFKAVTSRYTAEELVTKRSAVSSDVVTVLTQKLAKYHILVSDINVQNFHFDQQFAEAVRQKVVAGQNKLTAEQTLETARIQTEQRVVEAEGRAKASAIEAKALEEQGGDKFIALEAIKKWNGQLPAQWSGTAIPFLNLAMPK